MHTLALRKPALWAVPFLVGVLLIGLTLPARASTLLISNTSLPQAQAGISYSQVLTATGGSGSYTWSIPTGALPTGLALNGSSGAITGTPTAAGTSTFTVQVTDTTSDTATQVLSIAVSAPGTLSVATTSFAAGQVGVPYAQSLTANGGTLPYVWSITGGSLPAGLTLNASTGLVSGTPTGSGSTFTAQVMDAASHTATETLTMTVNPAGTLTVLTTTLPDGQLGVAYSQTLSAAGGVAPYTWSVTAGALPIGLTLNASSGTISGTPTGAGSSFTAQVADSASHTAIQAMSIGVNSASTLTITTTSLPAGQLGIGYAQTMNATGGTLPYTWSISAGSLPAGLTLNATSGLISGTPMGATSTATVEVADSASHTSTQPITITINAAGTLVVTTLSLPAGQDSVAYSQTLSATGGVAPYMWSIVNGGLPTGLTLDASTGVISGTPTGLGSSFTVQVADSASHTASQTLSIAVTTTGTLSIVTTSLPAGQIGVGYAQALTASGGTLPYTWSIVAGSLPAGLTLNASTGVISGTPASTSSSFTVQVADSASHTAQQAFSLTVNASSSLAVTTTALGDGQVGVGYSQTLTASGGTAPYTTWTITSGALPSGLVLGQTTGTISGTPTMVQTSTFTVQVTDSVGATAVQTLSINVVSSVGSTGGQNGQVLAVCQTPNANPQLPALCQIYTSGQLPLQYEEIIGFVILKIGQQPLVAEDFTDQVNAACSAGAAANPEIPALCQIFNSGQLPPQARNDIGRLVLRLTGAQVPNGNIRLDIDQQPPQQQQPADKDDRGDQGNQGQQFHQAASFAFQGVPAWARPTIAVTVVVPPSIVITVPTVVPTAQATVQDQWNHVNMQSDPIHVQPQGDQNQGHRDPQPTPEPKNNHGNQHQQDNGRNGR